MKSASFWFRYGLCVAWLLVMSICAVLMIPFFWGRPDFNRRAAAIGSWGVRRISGIDIILEGERSLESYQPCIYIGNHQHNFDSVIFGHIFPLNTIVIGKREIAWIPFFNLFYLAAGNIFLDRKRHRRVLAGIEKAANQITERGVSVMIFPEGTRNRTGVGLLPFKKGAFHMAIQTGLPLVPLVASPLRRVLDSRTQKMGPGEVRVRVLEPIATKGLGREDVERLLVEARTRMLAALESS